MFSREEIHRVIYGVAVADALGAPFEFFSPEEIKEMGDIQMSGGENQLGKIRPGEWTDDTEMTLLLAETIGEGYPINWQRLASRYISWADSQPKDIGTTTRAALEGASDIHDTRRRAEEFHLSTGRSAGNGTIMRASPLAFIPDRDLSRVAREEAQTTHWAREAGEASFLKAETIRHLLRGENHLEINTKDFSEPIREAVARHGDRDYVAMLVAEGGSAWSSLAAGLWSLSFATYEEGVREVIRLGWDTDTNAACAGAFLAARGEEIPKEWINKLENKARIDRAIDALWENLGKT